MQEDQDNIYKWAEDNAMKFNENKFKQLSYGQVDNVSIESYKNPSKEDIQRSDVVKDLGVITNGNITFREHIDSIVTSSRLEIGILLRIFQTRDRDLMKK